MYTSGFILSLLAVVIVNVNGACDDLLNANTWLDISDGQNNTYRVEDCAVLVDKYVGFCEDPEVSGEDGFCCASCPDSTCLDKLSKNVPLIMSTGKIFKDCADIVTDEYRALCLSHGGPGDACCQSCSDQDLDCVDELKSFSVDGKPFKNCAKLISKHPCLCRQESIGAECCLSCSTVDTAECLCQDKLSAKNPLTLNKGKPNEKVIKSCAKMVKDFPILCDTYGGEDEVCCKSCEEVDTSCVDSLKSWTTNDGKQFDSCAKLVKKIPCSCDDSEVAEDCCASCDSVDLAALRCDCQDRLSKTNPLTLTLKDGSKMDIKSCSILADKYAVLCNDFGGDGNACCRSCEGVDLTCVDELLSFTSSTGKKYPSCEKFIKANPCQCYDEPETAEDCCDACSKADISGCDCRDKLNKNVKITVTKTDKLGNETTEEITSCKKLVKKYPQFCSVYGGPDKECCASCP